MKNAIILSLVVALFATSQAYASLGVGSQVRLNTSLPGDFGGQFGAEDPGNLAGFGFANFITFCVEIDQHISSNGVYTVSGISTQNTQGFALGEQAAFLYTQFRSGLLTNFDGNSADDANALQYGIWQSVYGGGAIGDAAVANLSGTAAGYKGLWDARKGSWMSGTAFNNWSGLGNVRVMQFGGNQDQLTMVPEPGSVVIWSVIGFGLLYARRRQKA